MSYVTRKADPLRVFLSHSHKDNDWCNGFVTELRNADIDVWYDREGLFVGSQWVRKLEQELQERDIYLIVLTPDSWASQWVQSELSLALGQRKQIIGILCKPTQVSGFLTNYQLLDVTQLGPKQAAQSVAASLDGTKLVVSPLVPSSQTTLRASNASDIDISGKWKDAYWGMELFLRQADTKITGSGTFADDLIIDGLVDGVNIKLKATSVYGKNYYDMDLTLVLHSGMIKGRRTEYENKTSLFGKQKFVKKYMFDITLERVDDTNAD